MSDIEKLLSELKIQYSGSKPVLFKKMHTETVAKKIYSTVDKSVILAAFSSSHGHTVEINYAVFKHVASPENYHELASALYTHIDMTIMNHGGVRLRVNLKGLSISAVDRYMDFIRTYLLNDKMLGYNEYIEKIELYNVPAMFQTIFNTIRPLIHSSVISKIEWYS